ncbi:hypothetical protein [Labedella populi]|uniref:hypothetical protein n=1 Tax=Labedella populi TaxID=2498850 RepID=UPI001409E4F0|nr:hypothetical protein [Labedella populi]
MERIWEWTRQAAVRAGSARASGAVYVPDRMASAAERRYFDSLVGSGSAHRDPEAVH